MPAPVPTFHAPGYVIGGVTIALKKECKLSVYWYWPPALASALARRPRVQLRAVAALPHGRGSAVRSGPSFAKWSEDYRL